MRSQLKFISNFMTIARNATEQQQLSSFPDAQHIDKSLMDNYYVRGKSFLSAGRPHLASKVNNAALLASHVLPKFVSYD